MTRVLALLALAGCSTTVAYSRVPLDCQDRAVDLVWRQQYGRTDRPPGAWWVPPAGQTCGRVINGARGFPTEAGCAGGASYGAWADITLVNYHAGWQGTALAHELRHVVQARNGLPPDMTHASADFQPGGAVALANVALAAAQLCGP